MVSKKEIAVEKYRAGEFSFGQVAEFAKISVWDVSDLLKEYGVNLNYDKEEFEYELKAIKWKKDKK